MILDCLPRKQKKIVFSPNNKLFASLAESIVRIWDIASQKLLDVLDGRHNLAFNDEIYVRDLEFSPHGRYLATTIHFSRKEQIGGDREVTELHNQTIIWRLNFEELNHSTNQSSNLPSIAWHL